MTSENVAGEVARCEICAQPKNTTGAQGHIVHLKCALAEWQALKHALDSDPNHDDHWRNGLLTGLPNTAVLLRQKGGEYGLACALRLETLHGNLLAALAKRKLS